MMRDDFEINTQALDLAAATAVKARAHAARSFSRRMYGHDSSTSSPRASGSARRISTASIRATGRGRPCGVAVTLPAASLTGPLCVAGDGGVGR
jgi:hypothetical protein